MSTLLQNMSTNTEYVYKNGYKNFATVTKILKTGCTENNKKIYRVHNSQIIRKYFDGTSVMKRALFDKIWG